MENPLLRTVEFVLGQWEVSETLARLRCRRHSFHVLGVRQRCVAATGGTGAERSPGAPSSPTATAAGGWIPCCAGYCQLPVWWVPKGAAQKTQSGSVKPNDFTSLQQHSRTNELLGPLLIIHFSSSKCKSLVKRPWLHQLVCTKCFCV